MDDVMGFIQVKLPLQLTAHIPTEISIDFTAKDTADTAIVKKKKKNEKKKIKNYFYYWIFFFLYSVIALLIFFNFFLHLMILTEIKKLKNKIKTKCF